VGSISNSELHSQLLTNTIFFTTTISQVHIHNRADKANFPSMCTSYTAVDKSKPSEPAKKKVMKPEPSEISELITDSNSEEKPGYEEADAEPL
jgi:hypothetical protein